MKTLIPRLLIALSLLESCSLPGARASESPIEADGWKCVSPRDEIRPSFEWVAKGGPSARGSLIICTDEREGLDGHWVKTFPVKGGQSYHFRAMRRVTNVPAPRRSVLARILWRDDKGQPVHHDEPGATSYRVRVSSFRFGPGLQSP